VSSYYRTTLRKDVFFELHSHRDSALPKLSPCSQILPSIRYKDGAEPNI
jgi:hypothetical protein